MLLAFKHNSAAWKESFIKSLPYFHSLVRCDILLHSHPTKVAYRNAEAGPVADFVIPQLWHLIGQLVSPIHVPGLESSTYITGRNGGHGRIKYDYGI